MKARLFAILLALIALRAALDGGWGWVVAVECAVYPTLHVGAWISAWLGGVHET